MELISISVVLLIGAILLFAKGNLDQSKELIKAKEKLNHVDERISQATTSVYTQKNEEIQQLELDLVAWKDKANNYLDNLSVCEGERNRWKSDCKMLFDWKQELELEKQRLQEELQRVYDLSPSLNPNRSISCSAEMSLRSSTPRDSQLVDIDRRLRT